MGEVPVADLLRGAVVIALFLSFLWFVGYLTSTKLRTLISLLTRGSILEFTTPAGATSLILAVLITLIGVVFAFVEEGRTIFCDLMKLTVGQRQFSPVEAMCFGIAVIILDFVFIAIMDRER